MKGKCCFDFVLFFCQNYFSKVAFFPSVHLFSQMKTSGRGKKQQKHVFHLAFRACLPAYSSSPEFDDVTGAALCFNYTELIRLEVICNGNYKCQYHLNTTIPIILSSSFVANRRQKSELVDQEQNSAG